MDKNTLRKVYLEKRKSLSEVEYERRNQLMYGQLVDFFGRNEFKSIHVYIPIKKNKEVDTFPFLQYLWSQQAHVDVVTGVSDLNSPQMKHIKIFSNTTFLENKWGIPEPQDGMIYSLENLDCVLIPMIVGGKRGHRIGYGKGYYDRFLTACPKTTKFVGLSMAPLLDGDLYVNEFDIPMDTMITPFQALNVLK